MDTTDPTANIRHRLKDLNTKACYLLVALSFVYGKNATLFLELALILTAVVAVLPVQDYFRSERWLNRIHWSKVALLTAAFLCTLGWVLTSHPAAPQPTNRTTRNSASFRQ
jgi:hypothetical protein